MKVDFATQISPQSGKLLYSIANKLILNAIEKSANTSVDNLISEIEKFYAFLPLPEIGIKVVRKIPEHFFKRRS